MTFPPICCEWSLPFCSYRVTVSVSIVSTEHEGGWRKQRVRYVSSSVTFYRRGMTKSMDKLLSDFETTSLFQGSLIIIMSPFVVAFIAFVLLFIFRILNLASQPRKPEVFCRDEKFSALLKELAPELEQPWVGETFCVLFNEKSFYNSLIMPQIHTYKNMGFQWSHTNCDAQFDWKNEMSLANWGESVRVGRGWVNPDLWCVPTSWCSHIWR